MIKRKGAKQIELEPGGSRLWIATRQINVDPAELSFDVSVGALFCSGKIDFSWFS
jgi:hypothetical protein